MSIELLDYDFDPLFEIDNNELDEIELSSESELPLLPGSQDSNDSISSNSSHSFLEESKQAALPPVRGPQFQEKMSLKEQFLQIVNKKQMISFRASNAVNKIFQDYETINITKVDTKHFLKHFFGSLKRKDDPTDYVTDRNIIFAAFTFIKSKQTNNNLPNYDAILQKHTELAHILSKTTNEQKDNLIQYMFYLKYALLIIPKKSKHLYVDVPSLLEGSGIKYILGSRQSHETHARVLLASRMGKLETHTRSKRSLNSSSKNSNTSEEEEEDDDEDEESDVDMVVTTRKPTKKMKESMKTMKTMSKKTITKKTSTKATKTIKKPTKSTSSTTSSTSSSSSSLPKRKKMKIN